jgi:hypothetical protein
MVPPSAANETRPGEIVSILEQSPVSLSRTKIEEACAPLAIREALFVHRGKARRRPVRLPERTREKTQDSAETLQFKAFRITANRVTRAVTHTNLAPDRQLNRGQAAKYLRYFGLCRSVVDDALIHRT